MKCFGENYQLSLTKEGPPTHSPPQPLYIALWLFIFRQYKDWHKGDLFSPHLRKFLCSADDHLLMTSCLWYWFGPSPLLDTGCVFSPRFPCPYDWTIVQTTDYSTGNSWASCNWETCESVCPVLQCGHQLHRRGDQWKVKLDDIMMCSIAGAIWLLLLKILPVQSWMNEMPKIVLLLDWSSSSHSHCENQL